MVQSGLINNENSTFYSEVLVLFILLAILFFSGCSSSPIILVRTSNGEIDKRDNDLPAAYIKDTSIHAIADRVGKQFKLKLMTERYLGGAGVAVNQNGSTQFLYFHYKTYEHVVTRDEARALIIQVVDELKKQIHSKEHFGSYFYYYPLEKGQLVVSISLRKLVTKGLLFFDDRWNPIEEPFVGRVSLNRIQNVCYVIYSKTFSSHDVTTEEPLEKAREIVQKQKESANTLPPEKSPLK